MERQHSNIRKVILTLLAFYLTSPTFAGNEQVGNIHFSPDKIYVKITGDQLLTFEPDVNGIVSPSHIPGLQDFARTNVFSNARMPFHRSPSFNLNRLFEITVNDPTNIDQLVEQLNNKSEVEFAERVPIFKAAMTPNDPKYSQQWALSKISASAAWDLASGNPDIIVAVIDNAIDIDHPDLSANIWRNSKEIPSNGIDDDGNGFIDDINGWDFANDDNDPRPPNTSGWDHGTHCSGIVSAVTNNNVGIASIGNGVSIMALKAAPDANSDNIAYGMLGIVYAADNGVDIISMSWSTPANISTLKMVIDYANEKGCICIGAAANNNTSVQFYPAAYDNVIAVANTNLNDIKNPSSNYGSWIEISAPGTNILSTNAGNGYGSSTGTSMAAPMVAGLAGLMLSLNPDLNYDDILFGMQSTAYNLNSDNPAYIGLLGAGRINASAAMAYTSQTLTYPPVAQFSSDLTEIVEGGNIQFNDNSLYGPTSWTWNFGDGTATSNLQNPNHVYASPGFYTVTLTAGNANGTDNYIENAYILVGPKLSCDTIANFDIYSEPIVIYNMPNPGSGYISGHNSYGYEYFADFFNQHEPYTVLSGAMIYFYSAVSGTPSATFNVSIWEDNAGTPGDKIASKSFLITDIVDFAGALPALFDYPVTITGDFYLGIEVPYPNQNPSTVAMYTTVANAVPANTAWLKTHSTADDTWYSYEQVYGGRFSNAITPMLADQFPVASFIQSSALICEGMTITYDASASVDADSYNWSFPGGIPSTSTLSNPTVSYPNAGTYTSSLIANGGCNQSEASAIVDVDVCTDISSAIIINEINANYHPVDQIIKITIHSWGEEEFSVVLQNPLGQLINQKLINCSTGLNTSTIDVANLDPGIYLIRVEGLNSSHQQKLLIY